VFRRDPVKTHRRLVRKELSESLEHLRMAASYAAGGAAKALAPRFDNAKKAANEGFDSLVVVARDGARTANAVAQRGRAKMKRKKAARARKRWPMMVGGTLIAAGAVGALVTRRRRQPDWDGSATTRSQLKTQDQGLPVYETARSAVDPGLR
jgi:hypothetical protein